MTGACLCKGMIDGCPLCGGTGQRLCERCGGLGYVARPQGEHVFEPAVCPACGAAPARSTAPTGLLPGMERWTFARLKVSHPDLAEAAAQVHRAVTEGRGWVVLYGPPGRGKSYLLAAAVNLALSQRKTARYSLLSTCLQELQEALTGCYLATMRGYVEADVLALDEFAEYNPTPWRDSVVRDLLVLRSDPVWMPTFLATNQTQGEISRRFDWLSSRCEMDEVIEISLENVPDLRVQ